ncbi:hypothetical protein C2G38_2207296 [Gigaspora rosea]|uniref:Uncharacterized protein n=1 Tax=Gigaspora rosea TaxID=44941 RepID=A0A397ULI9_9GLOM|nr:hypothetical protein C2G38_2207296 [Gigaspora rosea]
MAQNESDNEHEESYYKEISQSTTAYNSEGHLKSFVWDYFEKKRYNQINPIIHHTIILDMDNDFVLIMDARSIDIFKLVVAQLPKDIS